MLPVSKVVLYKHGVASFERQGTVNGSVEIELAFKANEMNDVLKTLTAVDKSGKGIISSISYDNSKPIERKLQESAIALTDEYLLPSFISSVKGAEVTVVHEGRELHGTILGITNSQKREGEEKRLSIYAKDATTGKYAIKTVPLDALDSICLEDENLQEELVSHLATLKSARKKDNKRLTIHTAGEGARRISVAYTIESPCWKVSYRIIIGKEETKDDASGSAGVSCHIQGWAIVDNISDEAWRDVELVLMTGSPHSLEYDLFTPQYKNHRGQPAAFGAPPSIRHPRAMNDRSLMASNCVPPQQGFPQMQQMQQAQRMPPQMFPQQLMNSVPPSFSSPFDVEIDSDDDSAAGLPSVRVDTKTEEVGDLFKYEISHPVSIASNQSGMVPILSSYIVGQRVLYYNEEKMAKAGHPESAVLITNSTGLTLETGPVTVLEETTYVGEAILDSLKKNETRFVRFSTETHVDVWKNSRQETKVMAVSLRGGRIFLKEQVVTITEYNVRSKGEKDSLFYIEHRFLRDCKLVDTPEPTNPKPIQFYIFKFDAKGMDTTVFVVKERKVITQEKILIGVSPSDFKANFSSNFFDEPTKKILDKFVAYGVEISENMRTLTKLQADLQAINENQRRLRENMQCLGGSSEEKQLRQHYVQDLTQTETKIKMIMQEMGDLRRKTADLETARNSFAESVVMEEREVA